MEMPEKLFQLFSRKGELSYGENISMKEHMLQSAHFAAKAGEGPELIVAALLHDIGHFTHLLRENIADAGIDGKHEESGANFLARYFPPEVVEPVRLHVKAKRYLCYAEPGYFDNLSAASVQSLDLQGGPMTEREAREFQKNPYFQDSVKLRKFDELGKLPELACKTLEDYRPMISAMMLKNS